MADQYQPPRAESVSPTPSSPSSETPPLSSSETRFPHPQRWSRRDASHRLSGSISRSQRISSGAQGWVRNQWTTYLRWSEKMYAAFWKMSLLQRSLVVFVILLGWTFIILSILYSEAFFAWLATVSKSWREIPGGWLIAFMLIFVTSVPPIIGYSTANTIAGFVYGFPNGWPIAASACIIGSLAAFMACRTVLSGHVNKLIGNDHRFVALGQVLRRDGILYLTGIRFCPLPFSLSNGFLATIPSISPLSFVISTALSTPKLLIHIFIGSRLAIIAEQGDAMPLRDKIVNYTGMIIGGAIGAAAGFIIYRRTMARAEELAREEATINAAEEGIVGYEDTDDTLMDPEDAADVMGDDDVSLWDNQGDDGWGDAYDDDEEDVTTKLTKLNKD
ncbi:SNARE associated golgi protein domain-containing protein [Trichoderma breve]|uniref:Golgi apparatus membrane protein TVP38 n=1 Tax=Trichoderma breve TaxID=2034170 RepID=A0A9W9BE84_9HYPO|nr:SNARE associated golgi protein domain-containing protein [Trichoderma breve]KAJ4860774.1 SNARE associated golgi protein domain-containing protein [Trichoderma breve]